MYTEPPSAAPRLAVETSPRELALVRRNTRGVGAVLWLPSIKTADPLTKLTLAPKSRLPDCWKVKAPELPVLVTASAARAPPAVRVTLPPVVVPGTTMFSRETEFVDRLPAFTVSEPPAPAPLLRSIFPRALIEPVPCSVSDRPVP